MIFFLCFLNENEFEIRSELTWHVDLEADQLAGPVVALVEQNAIELVPAAYIRRKGFDRGLEPLGSEVQRESLWVINHKPFRTITIT